MNGRNRYYYWWFLVGGVLGSPLAIFLFKTFSLMCCEQSAGPAL